MPNDSPRILTPEDRSALANMQLLARTVVEGLAAGRHRSPHKGSSIEFKEHRQYVKGDEIRSIDWKLFGKTDRLYIRQFEDETNLRAMIFLDQSGSMAYRGTRSQVSKHQFAKSLAACLATLLISQQDAAGIATFDDQVRQWLPPRSRSNHLQAVYSTLVQSRLGGETRLSNTLTDAAGRLNRRGMVVLISDCFDQVDTLMKALGLFRHKGSEVVVFQVFDPDELDFPFRNRTQFRNLEVAGQQRIVDPRSLRSEYLQRLKAFREALAAQSARERIDLIACTTDQPYATILTNYLARRGVNLRTSRSAGGSR